MLCYNYFPQLMLIAIIGDVMVSTGAVGAWAASRGVIIPSVRWNFYIKYKSKRRLRFSSLMLTSAYLIPRGWDRGQTRNYWEPILGGFSGHFYRDRDFRACSRAPESLNRTWASLGETLDTTLSDRSSILLISTKYNTAGSAPCGLLFHKKQVGRNFSFRPVLFSYSYQILPRMNHIRPLLCASLLIWSSPPIRRA